MDNVDFWDGLIRLIKYLSIAATAYFAWYGSIHETRDSNYRLTKAGKKVAIGIFVSLIFALMSQFSEDKRENKKKIKEDAEKVSSQNTSDSIRSEQFKRLNSLITSSDTTLRSLKKQESVQKNIMQATKIALKNLRFQNILQQKLIESSKKTIDNLRSQSEQQLAIINRLSKQESLQYSNLAATIGISTNVSESARKQKILLEEQQHLLEQSYGQIYPLSPISFLIKFSDEVSDKERPSLLKTKKEYKDFYKRKTVSSLGPFWPNFFAVKFYKKLKTGSWEEKAGLVYLVSDSKYFNLSIQGEYNNKKVYINKTMEIRNPERLMQKPNVAQIESRAKINNSIFDKKNLSSQEIIDNYILEEFYYNYILEEFITTVGTPSIYSIFDLIGSKIEIETLVSNDSLKINNIEINFGNNYNNRNLVLKQPQIKELTFDEMEKPSFYLPNIILNNLRENTGKIQFFPVTDYPFSDKVKSYRMLYTDIITENDLGIISKKESNY